MATFTRLEPTDLGAIAADFGIGAVHVCEPVAAGTINSIFSVRADAGHFCLRINEGKTVDEVRYEAALLAALVDAGVPAPLPRQARSGDPFMIHEGRLLSMFPWLAGRHLEPAEITPRHASAVGRALAGLHVAGLPLARRFERAGMYTFERICARVAAIEQRDEARQDPRLFAALAVIRDEMAWLAARAPVRAAAPRGVIHGDLFPDNVLFESDQDGDQVAALIDFEQASTGSLCYDLAVCVNAWCFHRDFDAGSIRAMLDGYQAVRALEPAEVRALPVELRAAAMRFTVTRITDVYLPGEHKHDKDFGEFLRRLERWREIGASVLPGWGRLEE
jgi:homoserine kinase type II